MNIVDAIPLEWRQIIGQNAQHLLAYIGNFIS